jgi:hypothetical protein
MRKHNYVVGFEQRNQVVYGKDVSSERFKNDIASYTQPMTILQAIRQLKALAGKTKAIYKLVKVDPRKEKFKQKILAERGK